MDYPVCKMSILSTLLELPFPSLKRILFYPEYQKMFLSGSFCSKATYKKNVDFLTKNHGLTPLQNVDFFFYFARTSLLGSKKHSFLPKILKNVCFWRFLLKKNI